MRFTVTVERASYRRLAALAKATGASKARLASLMLEEKVRAVMAAAGGDVGKAAVELVKDRVSKVDRDRRR